MRPRQVVEEQQQLLRACAAIIVPAHTSTLRPFLSQINQINQSCRENNSKFPVKIFWRFYIYSQINHVGKNTVNRISVKLVRSFYSCSRSTVGLVSTWPPPLGGSARRNPCRWRRDRSRARTRSCFGCRSLRRGRGSSASSGARPPAHPGGPNTCPEEWSLSSAIVLFSDSLRAC